MAQESDQLSVSVIHRLESGSGPVTVLSLWRVSEVLELPMTELFTFQSLQDQDSNGADGDQAVLPSDHPSARRLAFKTHLPLYSLRAAAGYFGQGIAVEPEGWVEASSIGKLDSRLFVARIRGDSMAPRLKDGDWAVFRSHPTGTRQGKIVLVQYRGPADPDSGGSFTVKKYSSEKIRRGEEGWEHGVVRLSPLNRGYSPIVLRPKDADEFRILAEFVAVLKPRSR